MAKNFTDFQLVSGSYTPPLTADGVTPGVTTTQATSGMYLIGYDTDAPGGERQYTIESVLLATQPYHAGLDNVTNESKQHMFNNSNFTGHTSADNLTIHGDLVVEGDRVEMNTTIASTSALGVTSTSPDSTVIALEVTQQGSGPVARFLAGSDLGMDINTDGHVGVGVEANSDTTFTLLGDMSANGQIYLLGHINGRDITQDGTKLDNTGPYADSTALNLASVRSSMEWLKLNDTNYADITPANGFDVLEDGEIYKKTPANQTIGGDGIGDYSTAKLATVETNADKTANHSADIIYNQIPDGPYTGDTNTTHVKMTSAERVHLSSVRDVQDSLYVGDDGTALNPQHIAAAYHDAYPDFWSTANEMEYRAEILPTIGLLQSAVTPNSASWNDTTSVVTSNSAEWANHTQIDHLNNVVIPNSASWNDTHTIMTDNSGDWQTTTTQMQTSADDWNDAYETVNNPLATLYNTVTATSGEWDASVNNSPNQDGSPRSLPAGQAELSDVNITSSLTAQSDVKLGGSVMVLSAGEWKPGVTATIPLGDDNLVFVDGILVDWQQ
jgi:hypothetical protein